MVRSKYSITFRISSSQTKSIPNHTGNCLLLKNNIDANTPPPKPNPVLINALDNTTSHLSLSKFCEEVGMICEAGVAGVDAVDEVDAVVLDIVKAYV